MVSHFFVTADVTPNKTQNERLKVAFWSRFLRQPKTHRFGFRNDRPVSVVVN